MIEFSFLQNLSCYFTQKIYKKFNICQLISLKKWVKIVNKNKKIEI